MKQSVLTGTQLRVLQEQLEGQETVGSAFQNGIRIRSLPSFFQRMLGEHNVACQA